MKNLIVLFCCLISISAFAQKINYVRIDNGVRVVGGRLKGGGLLGKHTHMALEQYKEGDKCEYYLKVFFYNNLFEGIVGFQHPVTTCEVLPGHGKILIKSKSGRTISLQSVFHKIGVKYSDESFCNSFKPNEFEPNINSVAYYPISEEDIIEISQGIEKWRIDFYLLDMTEVSILKRYADNKIQNQEIKPNDFAKKISKLYSIMSDENNNELQKKVKEEEERKQAYQKAHSNHSITDGF